jgi:Ca2+-binding EF-hand superfamily protein
MKSLLAVAAGFLALSGAALAQDITSGHLDALDANDDGTVDAAEFDAYMLAAFESLDANGDGYVTLVEASAVLSPEQFAAANTNGDDGLSESEFVTATRADFATADVDEDGALD